MENGVKKINMNNKQKQAKNIVHALDSEFNTEHNGVYFMTDNGYVFESAEFLILDEKDLIAAKDWHIV